MIPSNIKSLILDMDGVLWRADSPIGDLRAIFDRIRALGLRVAFATNNGSSTPEMYVERLAGFGVQVEPWQVVTSALAVAEMLDKVLAPASVATGNGIWEKAKVFAIGEAGVMDALREKGIEPLSVEESEKAQAVVVGIDRQINFSKMMEATLLVRRGLPFYATNPDKTFPTPRGEIPGAGAWISVITTSTGVEPIYAGKPGPYILELARERLGTERSETLVVGDRLETDILGGQNAGMPVALVLSGVSTWDQGQAWMPSVDFIAQDLGKLVE